MTVLYVFLVTLQPLAGVPGGPTQVRIEAHDANSAKRLAQAQYGASYRVSNAAAQGRVN